MRLLFASGVVLLLVSGAWGVVPGMLGGLPGHELRRVEEDLRSANVSLPKFIEVFETAAQKASPIVLAELQSNTTAWPNMTSNDLKCVRDLLTILNAVKNTQMWALNMVDSGTKLQSGILQGNTLDLGQYDECVEVETPNFRGQHCLIPIIIGKIVPDPATVWKFDPVMVLTMSQCFPSTCSYGTVATMVNIILTPVNNILPANIKVAATVAETDCHTNDGRTLKSEDWVVTAICVFIILLVIISTSADMMIVKDKELTSTEQVLRSFSIYTNGKKLFNTKSKGDEMTSINGIKFLSMCWVLLGHKYLFTFSMPLVNPVRILEMETEWTKMFIINGTLSVDTFFMMAGLLNAYGFFSLVEKRRKYNILDLLMTYIHRFIRLLPPYMMVMAITGTLLFYVGDGPMWDRVMVPVRDGCQKYWWTNILFVNNYILDGNCVPQSWYLGADMEMFWVAPFVLYPMWRWPVFGMIEFVVVTIASIASPFAVSYIHGYTSPFPVSQNAVEEQIKLYLPTHTRFQTYVVGIFAGYLLYKVRNNKLTIRMKPIMWFAGWMAAGIIMLYSIFGIYWFIQPSNPYSQLADSFYIALFRFIWAIGVAWVIFACVTGHGGIVNSILSLKIFWPLGRLSYCLYLTHMAILQIKMGLVRTALHISDYNIVEEFFGDLFFTLCSATVLSLLLEAPTLALEKLLFGNRRSRSPPSSNSVTNLINESNAGGLRLNY